MNAAPLKNIYISDDYDHHLHLRWPLSFLDDDDDDCDDKDDNDTDDCDDDVCAHVMTMKIIIFTCAALSASSMALLASASACTRSL